MKTMALTILQVWITMVWPLTISKIVDVCPTIKSVWSEKAEKMNCSSEADRMSYHCLHTDHNKLVEVCARNFIILSPEDGCPYFSLASNDLARDQKPCAFKQGCPSKGDAPFFTDELYKYPGCIPAKDTARNALIARMQMTSKKGTGKESTVQNHANTTSSTSTHAVSFEHDSLLKTMDISQSFLLGSRNINEDQGTKPIDVRSSTRRDGGNNVVSIRTFVIGLVVTAVSMVMIITPIVCISRRRSRKMKTGTTCNDNSNIETDAPAPYAEIDDSSTEQILQRRSDASYLEPVSGEKIAYNYTYQDAISKCVTNSTTSSCDKLYIEVLAEGDVDGKSSKIGMYQTLNVPHKARSRPEHAENKTGADSSAAETNVSFGEKWNSI